jgi:hypothetical protein
MQATAPSYIPSLIDRRRARKQTVHVEGLVAIRAEQHAVSVGMRSAQHTRLGTDQGGCSADRADRLNPEKIGSKWETKSTMRNEKNIPERFEIHKRVTKNIQFETEK